MSNYKYPSIIAPQMATIVFIILQICFARRAVLKIGEYLTIIPRERVGFEMVNSQRGPQSRVGYNQSHIQQARME